MVVDDGLLIHENHEKPDYVIVVGGSIKGSFKEMTIGDAELYKENHIRTKLGMERSDESPAREAGIKRTCCICHSRSELRCSVCRTKYCSVSCQKKKRLDTPPICMQGGKATKVRGCPRWFGISEAVRM